MNDTETRITEPETTAVPESTPEAHGCKSDCSHGSSICRPHTSLFIAAAALIVAGYALFSAPKTADTDLTDNRITAMESEIASLKAQLSALGKDVADNRENLIQTKLQRALTSIQDLGAVASQETRATISEVEKMLRTLSNAGDDNEAPAAAEPAAAAPATETAPAEAAPTEATPAESTPATPAEATPNEAAPATDAPAASDAPAAPATDGSNAATTPSEGDNTPQAF